MYNNTFVCKYKFALPLRVLWMSNNETFELLSFSYIVSKAHRTTSTKNHWSYLCLLFVGTFTIFAPTDAAFDAVGTEAELLKDTAALANILKYHVVKGVIPSSAAKNELQLETLAGTKIRFNIYSHNHVRIFIDFIYIFKINIYLFLPNVYCVFKTDNYGKSSDAVITVH